ncbi:hypothetical protein EVC45_37220 [Paraburkholderia sp. UYCP14C]|uniref:hypothetical protein n=1 Tax=Paraburkholderia sp. UYCP14C TaxID=2511130 RepID=UPI00102127F8|nr:hypothetical protein [Paraburkholderia sp. UYCP14C]RZF24725.1 hypothetical protein EVC45_37220 [Paraburkholderia sp. UYCP14C]
MPPWPVWHIEIRSLGRARAALLGFAVAILAYNVLAVLKRSVKITHTQTDEAITVAPDVSTSYLALHIRGQYEGMLVALPPEHWSHWSDAAPVVMAGKLSELASRVDPFQVRSRRRGLETHKLTPYVEASTARSHHSTARLLMRARKKTS